jgi:hypothetical protein
MLCYLRGKRGGYFWGSACCGVDCVGEDGWGVLGDGMWTVGSLKKRAVWLAWDTRDFNKYKWFLKCFSFFLSHFFFTRKQTKDRGRLNF